MASQQILFTVMPRGTVRAPVTAADATLPVSVLVSPRLYDDTTLGAFPDWLTWTQRLVDQPLSLEVTTPAGPVTATVDASGLRPDLWAAMFDASTPVHPYVFPDYSEHSVLSWPQRFALSTVKGIYGQAGVDLALPDRQPRPRLRREQSQDRRRQLLRALVNGLATHWDDADGERRRDFERGYSASPYALFPMRYADGQLGPDGLLSLAGAPGEDAELARRSRMAGMYAVCSHVPRGKDLAANPPDLKDVVDFHRAVSALGSYPELMRDVGLVLDLDLPASALALGGAPSGTIQVTGVSGADWQLAGTQVPPTVAVPATRYVLTAAGGDTATFTTAWTGLGGPDDAWESFLGLVNLHPKRYGLAQVDIDGALHKLVMLADTWYDPDGSLPAVPPAPSTHPEVFDETTTVPALRSGGISLFADGRGRRLASRLDRSKKLNDALGGAAVDPLLAEDLTLGYRIDVWDSHTAQWHSLHRRDATYRIGALTRMVSDKEGFTELAATQAGPDPDAPPATDLYLHESVARWAGWSLSVPPVGRHLSADPDPAKALEDYDENPPATTFPMTTDFGVVGGSLPSLRFGRRYRLRARLADVCGNGLSAGDALADEVTANGFAVPSDPEGFAYLRYEPVAAPQVVVRDEAAMTGPGSTLHRLVIRTANTDPSLDATAAPDLTASDRHLVPPQVTVDLAEKLGMLDTADGSLDGSAAMYALVAERDRGRLPTASAVVDGHERTYPIVPDATIAAVPYLPDVLSRGVALRDLPNTPDGSLGTTGATGEVAYRRLGDPSPRPGSATLADFGPDDWARREPLRLTLADGSGGELPTWDAGSRTLTVPVPRGSTHVVPLTSWLRPEDLRLMGVWQWVREYIESRTARTPDRDDLSRVPWVDVDAVAHVLQRAVEGGHWMLTPPTVLTLVHAVQQPLGVPELCPIPVQHKAYGTPNPAVGDETWLPDPQVLQTTPERVPTQGIELAPLSSWRRPGSLEAYLLGGVRIHAASTEKVDLLATWTDPVDDPAEPGPAVVTHSGAVDEIPVRDLVEGVVELHPEGPGTRRVAFLDVDHDLLCLVRDGDTLGNVVSGTPAISGDAAPRHHLGDTRHHRVSYTAVATCRYREYFPADAPGGFTRSSEPVEVHVPASTRPQAPRVAYVVPTFGWQRQGDTNVKRSVRFGGGLRVFLERGWWSSGEGELLGVTTYSYANGPLTDHDRWKPYVTEWGADPIWQSEGLWSAAPSLSDLPGALVSEESVALDAPGTPLVDVAGYPVQLDPERNLWFADVTVTTESASYLPFVRLGLCRYQPYALPQSKISRVVTADFAQLTPSRAVVVAADPYHPRRLRVTLTGITPSGPAPVVRVGDAPPPVPVPSGPVSVEVVVQERRADLLDAGAADAVGDLAWVDVEDGVVEVREGTAAVPVPVAGPDLLIWTGTVEFATVPDPGRFRLLVCEYENHSANHTLVDLDGRTGELRTVPPRLLVFAEAVGIDAALVSGPPTSLGTIP